MNHLKLLFLLAFLSTVYSCHDEPLEIPEPTYEIQIEHQNVTDNVIVTSPDNMRMGKGNNNGNGGNGGNSIPDIYSIELIDGSDANVQWSSSSEAGVTNGNNLNGRWEQNGVTLVNNSGCPYDPTDTDDDFFTVNSRFNFSVFIKKNKAERMKFWYVHDADTDDRYRTEEYRLDLSKQVEITDNFEIIIDAIGLPLYKLKNNKLDQQVACINLGAISFTAIPE